LARLVSVPGDVEGAVAVDDHVIADVLGADHVVGAVAGHVERAFGAVKRAGHHGAAVAADVDRVGRAAHLPERNALVDAGGHGRDIDDAGAVYGNRVRVLTVPGGVDDHHAGGVEAALPGEGEAAAVHVVNSGGHVQRGLAADRDAVLVNAGLNGADLDARE